MLVHNFVFGLKVIDKQRLRRSDRHAEELVKNQEWFKETGKGSCKFMCPELMSLSKVNCDWTLMLIFSELTFSNI